MSTYSLMMVDADAYYAGIYASRFEAAGWKVTVEEGIEGAKRRLQKKIPDVVIVDLDPLEEALVFLRWLRENPQTSHVVQIALTKLGDRETMVAAQEAGVDRYLLKGHFVPAEAVKKVKRILEEQSSV